MGSRPGVPPAGARRPRCLRHPRLCNLTLAFLTWIGCRWMMRPCPPVSRQGRKQGHRNPPPWAVWTSPSGRRRRRFSLWVAWRQSLFRLPTLPHARASGRMYGPRRRVLLPLMARRQRGRQSQPPRPWACAQAGAARAAWWAGVALGAEWDPATPPPCQLLDGRTSALRLQLPALMTVI